MLAVAKAFRLLGVMTLGAVLTGPGWAYGQDPPPPPPPSPQADVHEHVSVTAQLLTPTREASGTAWLPQTTPMYGAHQTWRGWDVRLNGAVSVQAIYEPGDRHRTGGASTRQVASTNWGMAMARRHVGAGRVGIRTMFSAEPLTVPGCGSLNLLATGEVCDGDTIHDRQQPHDLVMELAFDYDHPLRRAWRWQVYAGLAGEPALGPPGYPHRVSALVNPVGPTTHHWLDATHVTFGLVTAGVNNQRWKAELSAFNGRAPNEGRVALDLGALDSVAGRVSYLPGERLALQVSAARLRDATTEFPFRAPDPVVRVTASAVYHVPLGPTGIWATTLAYGVNHARELVSGAVLETTTSAALLETSVSVAERHTVFGRAEVAAMPAHHLHAHEYARSVLAVGKLQVGYVRHRRATKGLVPGIGGTVSLSVLAPELAPRYAGRVAPGFAVFLSLRPSRHAM